MPQSSRSVGSRTSSCARTLPPSRPSPRISLAVSGADIRACSALAVPCRDRRWRCCSRAALPMRRPCDASRRCHVGERSIRAFRCRKPRCASAFRHPGSMLSCRRKVAAIVRAVSPKGAMGLMQIMPRDLGRACGRATASAPIPSIRTTTSWRARRIFASCTTATALPASSRPTTPVPGAMRITLRPAGHCPPETRAYVAALAPIAARRCGGHVVISSPRSSGHGPALVVSRAREQMPSTTGAASSNDVASVGRVASPAEDWTGLAPQSEGLFVAPVGA